MNQQMLSRILSKNHRSLYGTQTSQTPIKTIPWLMRKRLRIYVPNPARQGRQSSFKTIHLNRFVLRHTLTSPTGRRHRQFFDPAPPQPAARRWRVSRDTYAIPIAVQINETPIQLGVRR